MPEVTQTSPVTEQQLAQLKRDGYFIVRQAVDSDAIDTIREIILEFVTGKRQVGVTEMVQELHAMPQDELTGRIRKLSGIGRTTPEIWNHWYAGQRVLEYVRHFLGDTIYLKYDSVFMKPARVGGSTPWHQDIGLWRDVNSDAWNAWLAVDPATQENGCLQFIPGTHETPVIPHVKYPDAVHGELPRELVKRTIAEKGVVHIELQPGDCAMWHSHLWHYSPENKSDKRRIGMGAVWINPQQASQVTIRSFVKAMVNGERQTFPPPKVDVAPGLHMNVNSHIPLEDIVAPWLFRVKLLKR